MKNIITCFCLLFVLFVTQNGMAKTNKYRCIWSIDPATQTTVAWNQVSGNNPIIYYGTIDYGEDWTAYTQSMKPSASNVSKGMHNHFARLTNLTPNTTYYFVIKDSEAVSRRFFFTTAPDSPLSRLSIIGGGDSRNNRKSRQNANLLVSKLRPHCVIFAGDMTASDNAAQWNHWFNDWQLTISEDGRITPIVTARGNHEYSNDTLVKLFDAPNPDIYYAFTLGGNLLRVYTLNSMISASGNQAKWLENDLQQHTDITWKFAHYHHPIRPHTGRKRDKDKQRTAWATKFYDHGVNLVMECDAHTVKTTWPIRPYSGPGSDAGFIRDDEKGTIYVGEGCWGAPLRPNDDDKTWTRNSGKFNQFKWIFVDYQGIEVRTIKTDNAAQVGNIDPQNIFTPPANLDIWSPSNGSTIYINNPEETTYVVPEKIIEKTPEKAATPTPEKVVAPPPPPAPARVYVNELQDFNTIVNDDIVKFLFQAKNESEAMFFELQRSINGIYFSEIDIQTSEKAAPNTRNYTFTDEKAMFMNAPEIHYRIKYGGKNLQSKYTKVSTVQLTPWEDYYELELDPTSNLLRINYSLQEIGNVSLYIYNSQGKEEIEQKFVGQKPGDYTRLVDLRGLATGTYLLQLRSGDESVIRRIIIP